MLQFFKSKGLSFNEKTFLYILLIIQLIGPTWEILNHTSVLNSFLYQVLTLPDEWANFTEKAFVLLALLAAVVGLFTNGRTILLIPLSFYIMWAIANQWQQAFVGNAYAILAQSLRWGLPLALMATVGARREILKWCLSLTFLGHGLQCWNHSPEFLDFLMSFSEEYLNFDLAEEKAQNILLLIGTMDLALAWLALAFRHQFIYAWMGTWGFITSFERILYYGESGPSLFFERATHIFIPVYLFALAIKFKKNREFKNILAQKEITIENS